MSSRASLRQRHSLPSNNSLDAESPTSPVVSLHSLPRYRELSGLVDVLRTTAGTAVTRQRNSTFSYQRLVSRTFVTEDAVGDMDHNDDVYEDHETRLAMTIDKVRPLLTANVAVLSDNATSIEEKCLALDELLYLVEDAWTMPVIGREVAYSVCDGLREQGGLDVLLSNISDRTNDAADTQTDDIIILMSAIVLSQVTVLHLTTYGSQLNDYCMAVT